MAFSINIKDEEAVRLAAEVATLAGESKTGAVREALRERRMRLLLEAGRAHKAASDLILENLAIVAVIRDEQRH